MSIMVQQFVIHAEASCPRSTTERGHDCDAIAPVPGMLHWRVATLRPHSTPQGLQQKATFIEKNQASLPLGALFLVAASADSASGRSPLRGVRGHAALVSADSNPSRAVACRHNRDGNPRRTTARSDLALRDQSNPPADSPNAAYPTLAPRATLAGRMAAISARDQDEASPRVSAHLRAARHPSSDLPRTCSNRLLQPLPPAISLAQRAGLPHVGELPAHREFQQVSCIIIHNGPVGFH